MRKAKRRTPLQTVMKSVECASLANGDIRGREAGDERQTIPRDNPYWTVSYSDVCAAVDREISLRAQLAAYQAELPDEPTRRLSLNGWIHQDDYDSLRAAYTGLKMDNKMLQADNVMLAKSALVIRQYKQRADAAESTVAELRAENKRLYERAQMLTVRIEDQATTIAELRAKVEAIVSAYDRYRARGVMPAPDAYADLVLAINSARSEGGGA